MQILKKFIKLFDLKKMRTANFHQQSSIQHPQITLNE